MEREDRLSAGMTFEEVSRVYSVLSKAFTAAARLSASLCAIGLLVVKPIMGKAEKNI